MANQNQLVPLRNLRHHQDVYSASASNIPRIFDLQRADGYGQIGGSLDRMDKIYVPPIMAGGQPYFPMQPQQPVQVFNGPVNINNNIQNQNTLVINEKDGFFETIG